MLDIYAHVNADLARIVGTNGLLQLAWQIEFRNLPGFPKTPKF